MPTIRPTNKNTGFDNSSKDTNVSLGSAVGSTVRPNNNASTIRPDNTTSTIRPGNLNDDAAILTIRPGGDKTSKPNSGGTTSPTSEKTDTRMYQPRESYSINGTDYRVIKPLSLTSGEAQVFLVEDSSTVKHVLKLYYKGSIPNPEILNKVKSVNSANILFNEESHGAFEDRYFELMKYYDGDNLDSFDVRRNEQAILPLIKSMAIAIDFCHQQSFIHRDIKPSNFVFDTKKHNHLLLGDFGIAVECDNDGKCVSDMARTKIFAAPEVYLNTGDGKARFSTKSDFYSLGITIIYLWMGRDQFTHFEKENELQLATMKAYGNMPIPSNMPLRLYSLVKALIEPNPADRAGFKEVEEWLKGGNPFGEIIRQESDANAKSQFKVVFSGKDNLVASSPKELARMMFDNQELAISYLYKGRITQWLEGNGRPELAVEMERIKEDLYPRNTTAGLEAACYKLNPSMPFVDICGNNCKTSAEIAKSILSNFDKYLSQLSTNPDSRLIVFLQAHGIESAIIEFRKEFSRNKRLGLLYLAYRLDAGQPWYMTDDEGQEGDFNSENEIINWVSQYAISDQSLSDVVSKAFLIWVSKRNKIAAAAIEPLIKKHQGDNDYGEGVLYRLNPKVGLYYILDERHQDYFFSVESIARMINRCTLIFINGNSERFENARDILADVIGIQKGEKTSIYHYLKSKGSEYEKWIDWINYCLDTKSEDNAKKAGPYNDLIGLFKIIKGMGGECFYTFKSGETINNPSELSRVSKTDMEDAKAHKYHPVEAWISVFFQEDPKLDKSVKFTYEKRTAEYVNFLDSQGFNTPEIQRYKDAKQIVASRAKKLRNTLSTIKGSRWLVFIFTLLPLCFAAFLALQWRPSFEGFAFESIFTPVAVIMTILLCFIDGFAGKVIGEIIWGCIIGLVITAIIVGLSQYVATIAPYATTAIIVVLGIFVWGLCFGGGLQEKAKENLLNPDFEHLELEPLHEAYHPNNKGFDSSIGDDTVSYQRDLDNIKNRIRWIAAPIGIVTILGILYFGFPANFSSRKNEISETAITQSTPDFSNGLSGIWAGKFNSVECECHFEKLDMPHGFSMIISPLKDRRNKMKFAGTFHPETDQLDVENVIMVDITIKASGSLELVDNRISGNISYLKEKNIPIELSYVSE